MKKIVTTGKTVEEAIQIALATLGKEREACAISVIDEGKKGIFGFMARDASVEVSVLPTTLDRMDEFVAKVIEDFGVEVTFERNVSGKELTYVFSGKEVGVLIGKRGATLNALQTIVQLAHYTIAPEYKSIVLDAEGYRERRKETLIELATKVARTVQKTRKSVKLDPMPAFERKIIHAVITENKDLTTKS
ncbi:MAG: RNA-binding cell elongation regulator Jag/EloR, partial [Bacilli bacterium]